MALPDVVFLEAADRVTALFGTGLAAVAFFGAARARRCLGEGFESGRSLTACDVFGGGFVGLEGGETKVAVCCPLAVVAETGVEVSGLAVQGGVFLDPLVALMEVGAMFEKNEMNCWFEAKERKRSWEGKSAKGEVRTKEEASSSSAYKESDQLKSIKQERL